MPLQAGALDALGNFINPDCMARYMDDALPPMPDPEFAKKERRSLLIAISTGVINYLKAHDQDSIIVTVAASGPGFTATVDIQ